MIELIDHALFIVPDVGVNDDVAHMYFNQLASGVVSGDLFLSDLIKLTNLFWRFQAYIHSKGIVHRYI